MRVCDSAFPDFSDDVPSARNNAFVLLIIGGLSGAGKSTALQVLDDLNFFTVDGLPPDMLTDFCTLFQRPGLEHFQGLAMGVDFRRGGSIMQQLHDALTGVRGIHLHPCLLFLEARADIILRRYATTRRPHPLEREGLGLEMAMAEEQRRLAPVRDIADLVLDTSAFNPHDFRREIMNRWGRETSRSHTMRVRLMSFGFKYGVPSEADMIVDVRFLPNPYFVEELRPLTGEDPAVAQYIFTSEAACRFRERFLDWLRFLLPYYDTEGRYRLSVGIGCTGGKHRSVALVEYASHALRQAGYEIGVEHRHRHLG